MYDLVTVSVCVIDYQRGDYGYDDHSEHTSQRTKYRQRTPVFGFIGDHGCHRTVRNIDGGIEYGSPENIGHEHVCNFDCHGLVL